MIKEMVHYFFGGWKQRQMEVTYVIVKVVSSKTTTSPLKGNLEH